MAQSGRILTQVWKAFKELNPGNVGKEASRPVRLGIIANPALCQEVAAHLLGADPEAYDRAGDTLLLMPTPLETAAFGALSKCDALLVSEDHRDSLPGIPSERVFRFSSLEDLPSTLKRLLRSGDVAYTHIPLARALPSLRPEAASATIQSVSLENAAFVASTSLGNLFPNPLQPLTSVAETVGDTVVLTANQLRMLFRLAAIFDQRLGVRDQAPEVASILAAAIGWRSIARELVSKIPMGGGVVPKAAIAFAGTWAIGDGIAYYYNTGRRLTKEERKERFDAAYEKGKNAAESVVSKMKDTYARGRERLTNRPTRTP